MGLLTLYSGTLLPWLGGTFWFIYVDARFNKNSEVNRFRQAGYGFFLGYAVLFVAIMSVNKVTGAVSWPQLMVFLSLFSVIGAIAAWLVPKQQGRVKSTSPKVSLSLPIKALLTFAAVLTVIHLFFITIEIFTQPLYPWDAWLAWVYRAKVWFLAGGLSEITSAKDWVSATSAQAYTIEAWQYPLFPSIMPYWAALSLGHWSETLVNLPVLFAGLAMGMALYGQCREHGLNRPASLFACYLLYSIPLFATHLALAGYADIWMAGFSGLGFIALMRGVITRDHALRPGLQTVLGLLMILFSIWVKNEGAVWFLAALAMMILVTCRPRVPILIMVTAVMLTLMAFVSGITYFEVPLIGKLGLVENHLVLPVIGSFKLEAHNVLPVYWNNFIKMGSWNLLWVAVAGSLFLGFKSPNLSSGYRARRTALSFILIFLATQLFIFGFTDQGRWADTYTAINRLPIHFVPALLFAIIVIAHASLTQNADTATTKENPIGDS